MKKVLIIEDELILQKALFQKLGSQFTILQAADGEEGLQKALQERPDVILLDLLMPKMDGITMLQKLRENEWGKTVPVIILSNVPADINFTLGAIIKDHPEYYLIKSDTSMEDILHKVQELLGKEKGV